MIHDSVVDEESGVGAEQLGRPTEAPVTSPKKNAQIGNRIANSLETVERPGKADADRQQPDHDSLERHAYPPTHGRPLPGTGIRYGRLTGGLYAGNQAPFAVLTLLPSFGQDPTTTFPVVADCAASKVAWVFALNFGPNIRARPW